MPISKSPIFEHRLYLIVHAILLKFVFQELIFKGITFEWQLLTPIL